MILKSNFHMICMYIIRSEKVHVYPKGYRCLYETTNSQQIKHFFLEIGHQTDQPVLSNQLISTHK